MASTKDSGKPLLPVLYQAPADPDGGVRKHSGGSTLAGYIWAAAGGACSFIGSALSCPVSAYGIVVASWNRGKKELLCSMAVAAAFAALFTGIFAPETAISVILACVVSFCVATATVRHRPMVSTVCLVVCVTAAVQLGIDALLAYLNGTSLTALVSEVSQTMLSRMSAQATVNVKQTIAQTKDLIVVYWPMSYIVQALMMGLLSLWGARMGAHVMGDARKRGAFLSFTSPHWVAFAFMAGALLAAIGNNVADTPDMVRVIGLNVAAAARIALTLQGIAVLLWMLHQKAIGPFARAFLVLVALWLEFSYVVMSVVGVIDVFADFRSLRGDAKISGNYEQK